MTLTDEQLDALADRLWRAGTASDAGDDPWVPAAREAARWAEEQQGEVRWEFMSDGWRKVPGGTEGRAAELESAGYEVRAIRVIATTTKEPSHE